MKKDTFLKNLETVTNYAEIAAAANVSKPTAKRVLQRINEQLPATSKVIEGITKVMDEKNTSIETVRKFLETERIAA